MTYVSYLSRTLTFTAMLLDRWCNEEFILYIRKQVLEFRTGISLSMLKHDFYTVPEVEKYLKEDPRTRNNNYFAYHLSQIGSDKGQKEAAKRPALHTWS